MLPPCVINFPCLSPWLLCTLFYPSCTDNTVTCVLSVLLLLFSSFVAFVTLSYFLVCLVKTILLPCLCPGDALFLFALSKKICFSFLYYAISSISEHLDMASMPTVHLDVLVLTSLVSEFNVKRGRERIREEALIVPPYGHTQYHCGSWLCLLYCCSCT